MDDNKFIKPYDIVSYVYPSLDQTLKTGLFLVLFIKSGNVIASKLTSQFDSKFMHYSILALQRTNPFLQCDSYIQLDKLFTLNVKLCEPIGRLAPIIRREVKEVLTRLHYDVLKDLNNNITTFYYSPNKVK